jgi:RNA polymerase sigma-70 factor (ECF subfamily)
MVRRTLAQLSEEQRTVLILVCADSFTYKEAAEVLRIALGTVMSRLSRTRQELHRRLSDRGARDSVTPFPAQRARNAAQPE